jgi:polyisoprenoid-binding protein YceI
MRREITSSSQVESCSRRTRSRALVTTGERRARDGARRNTSLADPGGEASFRRPASIGAALRRSGRHASIGVALGRPWSPFVALGRSASRIGVARKSAYAFAPLPSPLVRTDVAACGDARVASCDERTKDREEVSMFPHVLCLVASSLSITGQAPTPEALRVLSPNGRFEADAIPAPGEPRKNGAVRCDLTIYELRPSGERVPQWKGLYDYRGLESGHFLADDGSAFVHVDDVLEQDRPLVRVIRKGLLLAALDARALHLFDVGSPSASPDSTPASGAPPAHAGETDRKNGRSARAEEIERYHGEPRTPAKDADRTSGRAEGRDDRSAVPGNSGPIDRASAPHWIDLGPRSCRLREIAALTSTSRSLDLLGRDGILRTIDLASGALESSSDLELASRPRIERALSSEAQKDLEPPFVVTLSASPLAFADEPLAIEIAGNFPTPGFELQGFDLAPDPRDPERFMITPLAKPPSGIVAQVLRPFRAPVKLSGLHVGSYAIGVRGREYSKPVADARVEIVPRNLIAMTTRRSPGSVRTLALLADGRLVELGRAAPPKFALVPVATVQDVERRVRELDPAWAKSAPGADTANVRDLAWISAQGPVHVVREESALEAPLGDLARKLEDLARSQPVRYRVDARASRVEVHTSSAGIFSVFGHDHTITAREIEGFIELVPGDLDRSRIELAIPADSLAVADAKSQADRGEIEKEMRANVLETARHPAIRFESKRITTRPLGPRSNDVTLVGDLELHGRKREITIVGRIGIDENEIEARGELDLRQTDYDIRPTSAAGGTVQVDDLVRIEFDLRARPQ